MAVPAGSLRREQLHQSIQDRVKQYILERGFQAGDALPAEAELARELGISRPSLREAIRVLQTLGVVETRHGSGTFVGRFSLTPLVDGLAFSIRVSSGQNTVRAIWELLQIREILERDLVASIAADLPDDALDGLDALVRAMEARTARGEEFSEEDRAFHQLLYRELGNPLIVQLIQAFWDIFDRLRGELPDVISELSSIVEHHRSIVDALQRRDGAAAAAAMAAHFDGLRHRIGRTADHT